jgi:hypothetical protein
MPHGIIFKISAILARPDTVSIDYDTTLREGRRLTPVDAFDPIGPPSRVELADLVVPIQVDEEQLEQLNQAIAGDSPISFFDTTVGRRDMRRLGLVNADGGLTIPKQTRLKELRRRRTGELISRIVDPPGLYLHEIRPQSFGLALRNPTANIYTLHFRAREMSVRT